MPQEDSTKSVRDQLHRHFLKYGQEVGGEYQVELRSFAYNSPFDLPRPQQLLDKYRDRPLSELRALHEHAKEVQRRYFDRLNAITERYTDADDGQVRKWWRQLCLVVARQHAIDSILTAATIYGPGEESRGVGDVLDAPTRQRTRSKIEEIAAKILQVLDSKPADWPETSNELLKKVDELRGNKPRSTYRYLHEKIGDDKPDTVYAWKEWAEDTV